MQAVTAKVAELNLNSLLVEWCRLQAMRPRGMGCLLCEEEAVEEDSQKKQSSHPC
jgi:hypothetical protein